MSPERGASAADLRRLGLLFLLANAAAIGIAALLAEGSGAEALRRAALWCGLG